jgi:hypothetical protein
MKNAFMKLLLVVTVAVSLIPVSGIVNAAPAQITLTATPGCGYVLLKWTDTNSAYQFEPRLVLDDGTTYPLEDFPLVGKYEYKHTGLETGKEYCYVIYSYDRNSNKKAESNKACATPKCEGECVWKCGCFKDLVPTAANLVSFFEGCNETTTPVYLSFPATLADQLHGWTVDQYLKICKEKGVKPCVSVCVGPNNNIVQWKADIDGNDCCRPQPQPVIECFCIKLTEVNCDAGIVKGTDSLGVPWCLEGIGANLCGTLKVGQCYKVCGEVIPPNPNERWSCKRLKVTTMTEVPCECQCLCIRLTRIQCQTATTNNPYPVFFGVDENGNSVSAVIQDATITDINGNVVKCEEIKPETCWKLCGFWREVAGAAPMFIVLQAQQVNCDECKPSPTECCKVEIKPKTPIPDCFKPGGQYSLYFDLTNYCDKAYMADLVLVNNTPGLTATIVPPNISLPPGTTGFNVLLTIPSTCRLVDLTVQVFVKDTKCPPIEFKISKPCCSGSQICCKYDVVQKIQVPDCIKPGLPFVMYFDIINYCPEILDFNFAYTIQAGGVSPLVNPMVLTVPAESFAPGLATFSVTFNPPANCNGDIVVMIMVIPKNQECPKREIPIKLRCCPTAEPCCKFEVKRTTPLPKCMNAGEQVSVVYRLYNLCDSCEPIPYIANFGANVALADPAMQKGEIPCDDVNYIDIKVILTMPRDCKETVFTMWLTICNNRYEQTITMPCCTTTPVLCCDYTVKLLTDLPKCVKPGQKYDIMVQVCNNCPTPITVSLSRCPGTTGMLVTPSTLNLGAKDTDSACQTAVMTIWADENTCKQYGGVIEYCLLANVINPQNCGDKGQKKQSFRIYCCGQELKNCCQYDVKPLNSPPTELAPNETFLVKYQVANKGDMKTCAPLEMSIKNIQPADALVITPMTFSIAAGGMVNLDVKIIMPPCTADKVTFSFEIWFEGCEKPAIVKFDVACTEGCKLNLMYRINVKSYWKNGEFVEDMPVTPVIRSDMNDRSFLVIRYVTKHLGATLAWDAADKRVTIVTLGGKKIELWIGKTKARVNGKEVAIDPTDTKGTVKPFISGQGYTMLPLRFVSDQLGAKQVKWHGDTQIAELIFDCPDLPPVTPVPMGGHAHGASAASMN